jgi:hypothetical protein
MNNLLSGVLLYVTLKYAPPETLSPISPESEPFMIYPG